MKLVELQKEEYQNFVHANGGSFLQDWEWGEFKQSLGQGVMRFGLLHEDSGGGKGRLIMVAQFTKSILLRRSYLNAAYGPLVLPEFQNRFVELLEFLCSELRKLQPHLLFVRIEPQFPFSGAIFGSKGVGSLTKTADIDPHKTLVLDLGQDSEKILAGMHAKTRYNIKVAQKHQLRVELSGNLGDDAQLFAVTAKKAGIRTFSLQYYMKLTAFFNQPGMSNIRASVYRVSYGSDVLAVNVVIFYGGETAVYLFGGRSGQYGNMMGPYLLHWQTILDAKNSGYKYYDFWGIEQDPRHPWYGFSKFKLGFGGEVRTYAGTYDFVFDNAWYNMYKGLRKLNRMIRK